MEITDQDKLNNPGVDEHTIQSVKAQYHFHKLSSVTLFELFRLGMPRKRKSIYIMILEKDVFSPERCR